MTIMMILRIPYDFSMFELSVLFFIVAYLSIIWDSGVVLTNKLLNKIVCFGL